MEGAFAADLQRCFADLAKTAVEESAGALRKHFTSVETRIAEGDAREEILRAADGWEADLIVVGARGLGGALLGSVALGVTRHAHRPVLVVKRPAGRVHRVVVGVDGSAEALAAVRFVARLPLAPQTVVRLLGIVEPPRFPTAEPDILDDTLWSMVAGVTEELRIKLYHALADAKDEFTGGSATVETELLVGQVAHELVREASEPNVDLLVVGDRGLGRFKRLLLGSVSDAALRDAPCAVLVVKSA
jgi:nucleotide-binding universal stress UspA family protein